MTDEPIHRGAHAQCALVKVVPTRQVVQVVLELPEEYFAAAVNMFHAQNVWIERAPPMWNGKPYAVIDGTIPGEAAALQAPLPEVPPEVVQRVAAQPPAPQVVAPKTEPETKPYGNVASHLYRNGFWLAPNVCAAIGSDEVYRQWIQSQKCIVCGGGDLVEKTGELKCEAAHVKRPSNSGMSHRPDHSCVPLCHAHHGPFQHQHGLPALHAEYLQRSGKTPNADKEKARTEAQEWFDKRRDQYLILWGSTVLARQLQAESMGYVEPLKLVAWAKEKQVTQYLPREYREHKSVKSDSDVPF